MDFLKRFRWWGLLPLPLLVILLNSFGPDGWREPAARLLWLSWFTLVVAGAHIARKILHDYADMEQAWRKANEGTTGAGLAFLGMSIVVAALLLSLSGLARAGEAGELQTFVPERARAMAPMVKQEIARTWPGMAMPSYVGALIEQETCIGLRHRSCWSPTARLKTAREEGAGLGQFTRAWDAAGRLRFDALAEVKQLAPKELAELDWSSVYQRADLGVRAVLVKSRDCDMRWAAR